MEKYFAKLSCILNEFIRTCINILIFINKSYSRICVQRGGEGNKVVEVETLNQII